MLDERGIIDLVVIGCDEHSVVSADDGRFERDRPPPRQRGVLSGLRDHRNEGIMVVDRSAARLKEFDQLQRRALAHVVDVLFVGQADKQDRGPRQTFPKMLVERRDHSSDHVGRHARVDLAGELDEAGCDVEFARLPGEVKRIDRDAMPAEARAWVKWHEAEGLRLGGVDHLPDVDVHDVVDQLQLIHERNVDCSKDIFGQLHRLGRPRRRYRNCAREERLVERLGERKRARPVATDDLRDRRRTVFNVARVLAFWREGEKKIDSAAKPGLLQDGLDDFFGRSWIGRRTRAR